MTRTPLALLMIATLCAGTAAQAQAVVAPTGSTGGNIAAHKQKELAKIQQKMQILQTLQSCVSGAADATAIKSCNATAQAARGGHEKKC